MAAARRVLCALRLLSLISAFIFLLARNVSTSSSSLLYKHRVTRSFRRAASLSLTALKHSKHGTYAVSLPFDSNVPLPAYFAQCCDDSLNPGPYHSFTMQGNYPRSELLDIGKSVNLESTVCIDPRVVEYLKPYDIFVNPPRSLDLVSRHSNLSWKCHMISTRISTRRRSVSFNKLWNTANSRNCVLLNRNHPILHNIEIKEQRDNRQHLSVRITSHHDEYSTKVKHHSRNSLNLIKINTTRNTTNPLQRLRLATWNIRSLIKKAAPICDLVISKRIDILALTETWLSADYNTDSTLAGVLNTLQDFDFLHLPRTAGPGGGVGVLLRKDFTVKQITMSSFKSMEYMDLSVTTSNSSLRLLTIYRPPPSKKNKTTHNMFLNEFSVLLEDLAVVTGKLIITGDFNSYFENANNREAARFVGPPRKTSQGFYFFTRNHFAAEQSYSHA